MSGKFDEVLRTSIDDPERFWLDAAGAVTWDIPPERALNSEYAPFYSWFPGGHLNMTYNALDRHVAAGRGEALALVYDSPVSGQQRSMTYRELLDEVARFAGVLTRLGVSVGDRVVVYMPMIPEAVIAMLGCARIGAVHSVVFGGFAPEELAARIDDASPVLVVSASCGIEGERLIAYKPLLDEALRMARHRPAASVLVQRPECLAELGPSDRDWTTEMLRADPVGPVAVDAAHPLYILYTSGTTGRPKGVVRDTGGYAVALAWAMKNVYDVGSGETMFTASDIGWVVGHSFIIYGPLLVGATTVLYEGKPVGTPDAGAFWRVISENSVKCLFTAPTAIRVIKKEDPNLERLREYQLSSLQHVFLAGERLDTETYSWAKDSLGVPVIDHWWQTETGWPIVANPLGIEYLEIKPGSPTRPLPGWDVRVLRPSGDEAERGEEGAIVIKLPMPPGAFPTLWNDDERFVDAYLSEFDGFYLTGDGGYVDDDGYVFVMGRTDDVINVAGHRLSTGSLEEVLGRHRDVAECVVIGVSDPIKGQVPQALVVLKDGVDSTRDEYQTELVATLVRLVREAVGPIASLRRVDVVQALPKTRSGKILRKSMRAIADGRTDATPPTIEDPEVLEAIRQVLVAPGGSQ